ncbi:MAG: PfkB family carbohydrate kinase [Planctomycetota bacterium]|nr:PfkB family carbohydrate kinase [Planctomycetota bacterium]
MNMWIENERDKLDQVVSKVDGFFCNDAEARMLADTPNLIQAGRTIMDKVKGFVSVKKGEHGSILFHREGLVGLPAFPADKVLDPTGAGDSFAGGFMGSLARLGRSDISAMKESVVYGTAMASFSVEGFGLEKLLTLEDHAISERRRQLLDFLPAAGP